MPNLPYLPSFIINVVGLTPGANEHCLAILNRDSTKLVRIWGANVVVSSAAAGTGVLEPFLLRMFTATAALIGGTDQAGNVQSMDPVLDALPASIDVRSIATQTADWTLKSVIRGTQLSEDEAVVSTLDADAYSSQVFTREKFWWFRTELLFHKPPTLRVDGTTFWGMTIQNFTTVAGIANIGVTFDFTVEGA